MSAIAEVLAGMGHRVSGSDLRPSPGLDRLAGLGVQVFVGHDAANLGPAEGPIDLPIDFVAISTAVPADNPEVVAARARSVPVLARAKILAAICGERRTVAVSGTHGKTTTSSLLALGLVGAGLRPALHRRRRDHRPRLGRPMGRWRLAGWWRRTRATAPSSNCRAPRRSSPASSPTTSSTTATSPPWRTPSTASSATPPTTVWCAPTTRARPPSAAAGGP